MKLRLPSLRAPQRGFTLIEILVVLVVVALLAAVAYPSFTNAIRKARRADAMDAITRVQQAQERYRSNNREYAGAGQLSSNWPTGLEQQATSSSGYYSIATAVTTAASNVSYSVTATAVTGKSQASDKVGSQSCATLTVTITNGSPVYTPAACWSR